MGLSISACLCYLLGTRNTQYFCFTRSPVRFHNIRRMRRDLNRFRTRLAAAGIAVILTVTMAVQAKPTITSKPFGMTADGKKVEIYTLTNSRGSETQIITYGGAV